MASKKANKVASPKVRGDIATRFQPGNTMSKGLTNNGRKRVYDRAVEAQALLEWAKSDKAYALSSFGATRGYHQMMIWQWAELDADFATALDQAKALVLGRLIERLAEGRSNPIVFARYGAIYDSKLREYERELKREELAGQRQITIQVRGLDQVSVPALEQADVEIK